MRRRMEVIHIDIDMLNSSAYVELNTPTSSLHDVRPHCLQRGKNKKTYITEYLRIGLVNAI
jgi:hypothetical protein